MSDGMAHFHSRLEKLAHGMQRLATLRYRVANHFLCSCVHDRVCMDHESAINYYYYYFQYFAKKFGGYGPRVCNKLLLLLFSIFCKKIWGGQVFR